MVIWAIARCILEALPWQPCMVVFFPDPYFYRQIVGYCNLGDPLWINEVCVYVETLCLPWIYEIVVCASWSYERCLNFIRPQILKMRNTSSCWCVLFSFNISGSAKVIFKYWGAAARAWIFLMGNVYCLWYMSSFWFRFILEMSGRSVAAPSLSWPPAHQGFLFPWNPVALEFDGQYFSFFISLLVLVENK